MSKRQIILWETPPDSYTLFGLAFSTNFKISAIRSELEVKVDNIFNTTYRDYLNQMRYFADDRSIDIQCSYRIKF